MASFWQVFYLVIFIVLTVFNRLTNSSIFWAFRGVRSALGLEQTFRRASDYLYYPFVFTAPVNVILMLLFLRRAFRYSGRLSLATDLCSILNAIYIAASGWVLFAAFSSFLRR